MPEHGKAPGISTLPAGNTDVDYLDMHIYSVNRDFIGGHVVEIIEIASRYGKGLAVGECWLYKLDDSEVAGSPATSPEIFVRCTYGLRAPLDGEFIDSVFLSAKKSGLRSCSFFWMQYPFACGKHNRDAKTLTYRQIMKPLNRQAYMNISREDSLKRASISGSS